MLCHVLMGITNTSCGYEVSSYMKSELLCP